MVIIDREPKANIASVLFSPEGLVLRPVSPQVPEVFNIAFSKEPIGFLDPNIKIFTEIGRNRFVTKLSSGFNKIKSSLDILKYTRVRVRGRGPCPGCMANSEEGHHGGSKCTKRGVSTFASKLRSRNSISLVKSHLTSSGLY